MLSAEQRKLSSGTISAVGIMHHSLRSRYVGDITSTSRGQLPQADKPILVTRFTKNPAEWANAEYFNVRTGKPCRITTADSRNKNVVAVRSYRAVLNSYVNNPETKFNGPSGPVPAGSVLVESFNESM